jgi:hypothetical protein
MRLWNIKSLIASSQFNSKSRECMCTQLEPKRNYANFNWNMHSELHSERTIHANSVQMYQVIAQLFEN